MIDIHTHILPVDDGARDIEQAYEMVELACKTGTKVIVATPHCNQVRRFENYEGVGPCKEVFEQLSQIIKEEDLPVKLLRGMEIMCLGEICDMIKSRRLISLNHSGYYLIEFPFDMHPEEMEYMMDQVSKAGGVPVIAHPERYDCVQDHPNLVYNWMSEGALTQINCGSLFGMFGRRVERTAHLLLDHFLVTCIATDAHDMKYRTTNLNDAKRYLKDTKREDLARQLLRHNPKELLTGKKISMKDIQPISERFRLF